MTVLSSEADFCVHGAQMAAGGESSPGKTEKAGRRKEKKLIKPREDRKGGAQKGKKLIKPREDRESGAQKGKEAD